MQNFNNNVYKQGHFQSWNNDFGDNFIDNNGLHKDIMTQKNIQTGGSYQAEVSGAYGEFTISTIFKSLPEQFHVMNDILLQQGVKLRPYKPEIYGQSPWKLGKKKGRLYEIVQKSTQLDHVIVSPYGIFIIETKNHKGWVFGDVNGAVWTQVLSGEANNRAYGGHDHYTFYNPVKQNETHIQELSKQLKLSRQFIQGMIVFTNPQAYLGNINCNCCYTLDTLYNTLIGLSTARPIWTPQQTEKIIHLIEKIDTNNYTNAKIHKAYVEDIKHHKEINKQLRK